LPGTQRIAALDANQRSGIAADQFKPLKISAIKDRSGKKLAAHHRRWFAIFDIKLTFIW